jgi:hypothetical protein
MKDVVIEESTVSSGESQFYIPGNNLSWLHIDFNIKLHNKNPCFNFSLGATVEWEEVYVNLTKFGKISTSTCKMEYWAYKRDFLKFSQILVEILMNLLKHVNIYIYILRMCVIFSPSNFME